MKEIRWKKRFFWSKDQAERFVQKTVASARCSGNYEIYCLDGMRLVNWAGLLWHDEEVYAEYYGSIGSYPAGYEVFPAERRKYYVKEDSSDIYSREYVLLNGVEYRKN